MSDPHQNHDAEGHPNAAAAPAMTRQAPGVRGALQAPVEGVTLHTGDVIGGKFVVSRYLGSSDGAVSYLCHDQKRDRDCVVKVMDLSTMPRELQDVLGRDVPTAAKIAHNNLTAIYGMGQVGAQQLFVAMEYVNGSSLARIVAQRRDHKRRLNLRDVFTVVAHLAKVLTPVHNAGLVHGVITPYNIMISRHGELKLGNLVFGRVTATAQLAQERGPFTDSIYVAPELGRDPKRSSVASDVYSVAMLAVELLSPEGLPADRLQAKNSIGSALSGYPPRLTQFLLRALDNDPSQRPQFVMQLADMLEEVARERGVKLGFPPAEGELPILPAVPPEKEARGEVEDDLFDIPDLKPAAADSGGFSDGIVFDDEEEEEGRYLVQKDGLDYGPFTYDQVLEQLYKDEIHEGSQVLDRISQERMRLDEVEVFKQEVRDYIPKREERLRRQAEQRAELQRKVKKGGVAVFVVGIVAGVIVLAGMLYVVFTQPDPEPLPMDRAFASLDFKLLPPPKEFTTVAVDKGVMQSIFNPEASEEEIAKQIKKIRKKRSGATKSNSAGRPNPDEENVTDVDMTDDTSGGKILTDAEVNEVILGEWGSLRRCVMKEFRTNPDFRGVTVQFFIRPTGTTGGVKIKEASYANKDVGQCLVSRFRAMKFPQHSGFNKGVVFPLLVQ